MIALRYIFSIALLLAAMYIVVVNWCAVIVSIRNARRGIDRHHSTVPLISFILTVFAVMLFPHPDKAGWMLAVPILDIAHLNLVFAVFWLPFMLVRSLWKKKAAPAERP